MVRKVVQKVDLVMPDQRLEERFVLFVCGDVNGSSALQSIFQHKDALDNDKKLFLKTEIGPNKILKKQKLKII